MRAVLPLNGGINRDASKLYVDSERGEVVSRKNCRVTSSNGSRVGVNVSVKGMEQVTGSFLPTDGVNKFIGQVEDKERDQMLIFAYNSIGNHDIYIMKGDTITAMGADADVLNFQEDEVIDATVLGDNCVFVSEKNPPRKISIVDEDGDTDSLTGRDSYDIQLAVRPPHTKPSTSVGSDSSRVVNKLIGKTFQFAYLYVYKDYTYSVLSPYSDIVVSSSAFSAESNTYIDNSIGNFVNVTYDLGNKMVRSVKLFAREGNIGSWFEVEEFETEGASGTRTYSFYNDVARKSITETEAVNLYSDVPRIARTTKAVQNRISLGNVLKGYDKTSPSFDLSVEYETIDVDGTTNNILPTVGGYGDYAYVEWTIPPTPQVDDVINISLNGAYLASLLGVGDKWDFNWAYEFSYIVAEGDTIDDIVNAIIYDIDLKGKDIITNIDTGLLINMAVSGANMMLGTTRIVFTGVWDSSYTVINVPSGVISVDTLPKGVSTFKAGSYTNVGIMFYDEYSRTSGV